MEVLPRDCGCAGEIMRLHLFHNGEMLIIEGDAEYVLNKADRKVVEWQSV